MAAAGTLTLTQNSAAVTGSGTAFTTALAAGGFIVATVGGTAYTLGIKSIESNTALTLQVAYNGPTTSGVAFDYVPFATLNLITSALAAQVTYAIRAANLDRNNWQQIFSGTGNVTVTLPDGTSWTGPAWNSFTETLNSKANASDVLTKSDNLASVSDKAKTLENINAYSRSGGAIKGSVSIEGSLAQSGGATFYNGDLLVDSGEIAAKKLTDAGSGYYNSAFVKAILQGRGNYGDARGAYAAILCQEQSGVKFSAYMALNGFGANTLFEFRNNGSAYAPSQWVSTSDERIKTNIKRIEDPLSRMREIKGVTWERLDGLPPGIGFIAQDVQKAFPEAVSVYGDKTLKDGTIIKDVLAPDTSGVAAALHHEAILQLMDIIEKQNGEIAELKSRMRAIDGLDN